MRPPLSSHLACFRHLVAAAALLVLTVAEAHGQGRVRWSAPPPCPDQASVTAEIVRLLGRPLDAAGSAVIDEFAAVVVRDVDGYRLALRLGTRAGAGERHMKADDCALLADAAARVLAQAVDPRIGQPGQARGGAAPTLTTPVPRRPVATSRSAPRTWRSGLALSAAGDTGTLPSETVGVRLGVAAISARARLELEGAFWPARDRAVADDPSRGGSVGLWAVTGRPCLGLTGRTARIDGCMGLSVGRMNGAAYGLATPSADAGALYLAIEQSAVARIRPGSSAIGLFAGLSALENLRRPRFFLKGLGDIHRPAALSVQLVIGAEALLF